jgi:hypothetical protein
LRLRAGNDKYFAGNLGKARQTLEQFTKANQTIYVRVMIWSAPAARSGAGAFSWWKQDRAFQKRCRAVLATAIQKAGSIS